MPDRFTADALTAALDDRARRVRSLGELSQDVLNKRPPNPDTLFFLAGAIDAYLQRGGDLCRDYLKITKPKSHRTPQAIWHEQSVPHPDEDSVLSDANKLRARSSKSGRPK